MVAASPQYKSWRCPKVVFKSLVTSHLRHLIPAFTHASFIGLQERFLATLSMTIRGSDFIREYHIFKTPRRFPVFMRRTTPSKPSEPVEPAFPLSQIIKGGRHAPRANPEFSPLLFSLASHAIMLKKSKQKTSSQLPNGRRPFPWHLRAIYRRAFCARLTWR